MASRAWKPNTLRWEVAAASAEASSISAELARRLGIAPLVAQVLANRGIRDVAAARSFLNPKLSDLHDPTELAGCAEAAERLARAVRDGRRIVIYGDYDVDGITAVAILQTCIRMLGGRADYYVPHRLEEGYGLNRRAVDKLAAGGAEVLVTVDCGISAVEPVAAARRAGMEVIVTDHHDLPAEPAAADVVVHPQLGRPPYPNPHLAGAGVALKVAWQLARSACGRQRVDEQMRRFLLDAASLAALGTIADVVPLVGENRCLATYGLRALPQTAHPGLRALLAVAGVEGRALDAYHVGFMLAPRLNAAGRMGHARLAVELLTDAAPDRCREIAEYLDKQNTERQKVERAIAEEAAEMVLHRGLDDPQHRILVLASEDWHGGVIGIVASRLVERFARPAILVALNGRRGQGSGRSVPGFHMRRALAACGRYLTAFGGHAMAGGLRIERNRVEEFAEAIGHYARQHMPDGPDQPTLAVDAETTLEGLSFEAAQQLDRMGPFGQGNPRPVVAVRRCRVLTAPRRMGRGGKTVSLLLGQGDARLRAVGFGMGDLADLLKGCREVDVAGSPGLNTFRGSTSVELHLKDVLWRH
ncbi:MAG: single-stranded-DNA-specific exonuclease RecJ [Planctomycetes bacterium]|nr:single-stranded-DNA-specific exonuclease RecJ [Planctomycetota bacterium]